MLSMNRTFKGVGEGEGGGGTRRHFVFESTAILKIIHLVRLYYERLDLFKRKGACHLNLLDYGNQTLLNCISSHQNVLKNVDNHNKKRDKQKMKKTLQANRPLFPFANSPTGEGLRVTRGNKSDTNQTIFTLAPHTLSPTHARTLAT